jgi:hypothetical protein
LDGVIRVSALWRWPERLPEYESQFRGSPAASSTRRKLTAMGPLAFAARSATTFGVSDERVALNVLGDASPNMTSSGRKNPPSITCLTHVNAIASPSMVPDNVSVRAPSPLLHLKETVRPSTCPWKISTGPFDEHELTAPTTARPSTRNTAVHGIAGDADSARHVPARVALAPLAGGDGVWLRQIA